jgi:cysteinyl-tRNA synthetase
MPDYGALSKRPLDEMEAGARVDVAPYKRSPLDFVLWKPSKPGEPAWPSPAGIQTPGRPGWHIECSAMAWRHLGETFDIHAGGIDLVFPHHENEVAQTRCCFGTPVMANYWLHNGFLQVEGEKMAKSAGNFVTIRELLETESFGGRKWPGDVLRLAMLRTHYRQPIDWTVRGLEESGNVLQSWIDLLARRQTSFGSGEDVGGEVLDALCDDLNTPRAYAELHRLAGLARGGEFSAAQSLHDALSFLGVLSNASFARDQRDEVAKAIMGEAERASIQMKVSSRSAARAAKNWAESDRIRDELAAMGIALKDNKDGTTTWEVVR